MAANAIFTNIPAGGGIAAPETAPFHFSPSFMIFCERNGYPKDRSTAEIWCHAYYLNRSSTNPMIECQIYQPVVAGAAAPPAVMPNPTTFPLVAPLVWAGSIIQERNAHGTLVIIANPGAGIAYAAPAIADNNISLELREFIRAYRDSTACAKAAIALLACHQTKEMRGRNYKSFRIIFGLEAPNEMLVVVAKAFKNRFALLAGNPLFAEIRSLTPFIMFHTKAYSSAGVILKAFEALQYIGINIPSRSSPAGPPQAWYPTAPADGKTANAIEYYRALDTVSHTIANQTFVHDKDVITAIATNEVFGQVIDDWKHGEKIMNNTPIAMYNTIKIIVRAALAESTAAQTAALAAGGGSARNAASAVIV